MTAEASRGRDERSRDGSTTSTSSRSRSRSKSRSTRSKHRSKSRDRNRSKSRDRKASSRLNTNQSIDEPLLEEQGQECLLLEDIPAKKPITSDDKDTCEAERAPTTKKSSRKVQQVLLVPTNGELLMERYRMAGQRAMKARALLDQALNWDVSVANRDRMASDAFLEAGKARLLVETEKTPELIVMLADAKAKGEEEACRAADYKVTKLIPDVNLSKKVGEEAVASTAPMEPEDQRKALVKHLVEYDGASTMNNKHHMQCFQNMFDPHVTARSEDDGNEKDDSSSGSSYDDDEAAEEHVFRAKQYLEFILPELGDWAEDSSMAPKAVNNPRNILRAYQQQLGLNASGDTHNLDHMSSLGFDESHSYDIVSSEDTDEDTFSMSSLNEIMDAPIDDFLPDRIMSMPSQLRHKLTVRMSFGGKSIRRKKSSTQEHEEKTTSDGPLAPSSEAAVTEDVGVIESVPGNKDAPASLANKEKKRNPRMFAKRGRSMPALPTVLEDHGGFLSRFRSMKRKGNPRPALDKKEDKNITDCIITQVLSDLSDAQSKQSINKPVASRIIAPALSELTDIASVPPRRDDSSLQTEDTIVPEDTRQSMNNSHPIKQQPEESPQAIDDSSNTNVASNTDDEAGAEANDKPSETSSAAEDLSDKGAQDLALLPSISIVSSASMFDDRYTIDGALDDEEDDIMLVEERYAIQEDLLPQPVVHSIEEKSPTSFEVDTMHGRYSPFPTNDIPLHSLEEDIFDNVLDDDDDKVDLKQNAPVDNTELGKQQNAPVDNTELGDDEKSEKENDTVKHDKRKRRSLMGLFRKEQDEEAKVEIPQSNSNIEPVVTSKPNKSLKKPSSLQKSLQKAKETSKKAQSQTKPNQKSLSAQSSSKQKNQKSSEQPEAQKDKGQPSKTVIQQKASQTKKIGAAKKHYSKAENRSSLKRALEENSQTRPSKGKSDSSQNTTKPQSSLKTALQLSQDTVEVMAMDSLVGVQPSLTVVPSKLSQTSHNNESPDGVNDHKKPTKKKSRHPPATSSLDKKSRARHGPHSRQRQSENKKPNSQTSKATPSTSEKGKVAHGWINSLGFHKKKKVGTNPPKPPRGSVPKKTSTSADKGQNREVHQHSMAANPVKTDLAKIEAKKLQSDPVSTTKTNSDISVATFQNPLLPFQLLKQLEDQSSAENNVKDVAERSIVQSHKKYMIPSPSKNSGEKENYATSMASLGAGSTWSTHDKSLHMPPGIGPQMDLRSPSPRVLGMNNTEFAGKATTTSADPDGLNARAKDVREIYGLPPAEIFGEERSRSFLSRITHETYRQDLDLPDP